MTVITSETIFELKFVQAYGLCDIIYRIKHMLIIISVDALHPIFRLFDPGGIGNSIYTAHTLLIAVKGAIFQVPVPYHIVRSLEHHVIAVVGLLYLFQRPVIDQKDPN